MMIITRGSLLALAVALAACGSRKDREVAGESAAVRPTSPAAAGSTSAMPGMPGMGGMPMQGGMMPQMMQAHMDTMMSMNAGRMKAMLPMHRQMVANMLAQMNQQMQSMNMPADTKWTALADSVRQDLVRMPEMSDQELEGFMPAHRARVMRLMAMHQQMMGGMRQ